MRLKTRNWFPCEIKCDRFTCGIFVAYDHGTKHILEIKPIC